MTQITNNTLRAANHTFEQGVYLNDETDEVLVEVGVSIFGSYMPATRFQPEEHPEIELIYVRVVDDAEELGGLLPGEEITHLVSEDELDLCEVLANAEADRADAAADHAYDAWKDEREERARDWAYGY